MVRTADNMEPAEALAITTEATSTNAVQTAANRIRPAWRGINGTSTLLSSPPNCSPCRNSRSPGLLKRNSSPSLAGLLYWRITLQGDFARSGLSQLCPNNWVPVRPAQSRCVSHPRKTDPQSSKFGTLGDVPGRSGIVSNSLVMRRSSVRVRPQAPERPGQSGDRAVGSAVAQQLDQQLPRQKCPILPG